jgi:16S rRNA (uracil1498-N3)-methyltransferase
MPGHRFFAEVAPHKSIGAGAVVTLSDNDAHHARDVLRLVPGAAVTVILRHSGASFDAVIESVVPHLTTRLLTAQNTLTGSSRISRVLFALCKGDRNDLVCEKATELGVGAVHFFQAERSIVKLDSAADCEKKRSRWIKIAEGAAKQCGRADVPEVAVSRSLKEALGAAVASAEERLLFCSLTTGSQELRAVLPPLARLQLCIGPEGDFTQQEESLLLSHHGEPISLGPTVLRSETAAIAAISMALGLWGYDPISPVRG